MSTYDTGAPLSEKMNLLVNTWGLGADCAGETLSKNDVLLSCSIGDVAAITKLKPRPMQAFTDSTSALGLRVVGMLSALLQHQVAPLTHFAFVTSSPSRTRVCSCRLQMKLLFLPPFLRASREILCLTPAASSVWDCGIASAS
jgi:hypothetical protein